MSDPKDLYSRSVKAAKRYCGTRHLTEQNELLKARYLIEFEAYRVGWMIGWRAGNKAKRGKR